MATQEKVLNTSAIEAGVYHTSQVFKEASETVQHIVAGCKIPAGTAYMEHHNQVAGIGYRNM